MKTINFKRKSKKSLLEIVRISGVMPEADARKMRLPELREHLQSLMDAPAIATALSEASLEEERRAQSEVPATAPPADEKETVTERPPRRRGRPRKSVMVVSEEVAEPLPTISAETTEQEKPAKTVTPKTKPDRPPSEPPAADASAPSETSDEAEKKMPKRGSFRSKRTTDAAKIKSARAARNTKSTEPVSAAAEEGAEKGSRKEETAAENGCVRNGEEAEVVADAPEKPSLRKQLDTGEDVSGVLEIMPDGYGFLRRENYIQSNNDIYVPPQFIRRFNLRQGDFVVGPGRIKRDNDRYQGIFFIKTVNGLPPDRMIRRPHFERLTPIYPNERYHLETVKHELSTRIIDLVSPIGKGQRGMIVSPPKAGKTILLQKIANAISTNDPKAKLIVLLIDERPEEVTDMQRSIKGEVVYSTFDKTPENHVRIAELVLERAMRLVELGEDVVILLDSITRLSRAYNLTINPTGRTLSGGLDPGALYGPKRFFGAARNIENGGSLTIVATALVDTGSRMDEVIFEEFKGTGNMEVILDRKLSEKRVFPAIDIVRSGTRREELLLDKDQLEATWAIRKAFGQMEVANVTETIINLLMKTNNNHHFVSSINVSLNDKTMFETMQLKKQGTPSPRPY